MLPPCLPVGSFQSAFFITQPKAPSREWCHLRSEWVCASQLAIRITPYRLVYRPTWSRQFHELTLFSQVILGWVKLTLKLTSWIIMAFHPIITMYVSDLKLREEGSQLLRTALTMAGQLASSPVHSVAGCGKLCLEEEHITRSESTRPLSRLRSSLSSERWEPLPVPLFCWT